MKFNITKHCRDRYIERVLGGANSSPNIFIEMLRCLSLSKNITSKISEEVPRFVLYIKQRYGSDKGYTFLKNEHTIFVLVKRKQTNDLYDVLTCYIDNIQLEQFKKSVLSREDIFLKLKSL